MNANFSNYYMNLIWETDRLLIRELRKEDFENVYALNTDPEVMKYHSSDGRIRTLEEESRIFVNILKGYSQKKKFGIWGVFKKEGEVFIGLASLVPLKETGELQAGVRLHKKYWNNGFGSEIMKALVVVGIFKLELNRVVAITNPNNRESMKTLEKAGFKWEKIMKTNNEEMNYYSVNKFHVS